MLSRIKVGDTVQVMSGKDRNARGVVLAISVDKMRVKVKGVALVSKFSKKNRPMAKNASQDGKELLVNREERFIAISSVMPICPQTDKPCRVRTVVDESGNKVRVSARSGLKI